MVFSNNLLMGAAGQSTGYEIENSLRLDGTGDMSRTVASDGNLRTWTISFWLKRSTFGTNGGLGFNVGGTYVSADNRSIFRFHSSLSGGDDDWYWAERSGGAWREDQATSQMYVDPSAWAHYMCVWDTDGGTTPRARRYVNGVLVSDLKSGGTAVGANVDSGTNQAGTFQLFDQAGFPGREFEGYCAETHFVDGTALGPTSFGEYNNDGVWIPKAYSGSYGTNGFYLDFADSSDLGKDVSGNGNDFTSSGLATTDQMSDTPTNNFCTMNPLDAPTGSITLSNGNLDLNQSSFNKVRGTIAFDVQDDAGFYFEVKKTNGNFRSAGIVATDASNFASAQSLISVNPSVVYYMEGGEVNQNGPSPIITGLPTFATNDVLGVAVRNGKVYFAKNNTWVNSGDPVNETGQVASITGSSPLYSPAVGEQDNRSGITNTVNFGATAFAYTPPTGFKALSTANLATPSIKDGSAYFNPVLFTGNSGTAFSVTGVGFQPDWVWGKPRSLADNHRLMDVVRGSTKQILSNAANAEFTQAQGITSFDSDGFTVGTHNGLNNGTNTYVAWCWLADNTTGSSNEDGDTTSTVSASATSGFSIVKWTGTGANTTLGHGLGAAPQMILVKNLADADSWVVYHEDVGATKGLTLDTTAAPVTASTFFNNTAPTSSVFSVGSGGRSNGSSDGMIAYCFAEIPGYSSFGSYTGNGSTDGPFVYTGFTPRYILFKRTNATESWPILDTARGSGNFGADAGTGGDNPTAANDLNAVLVASTAAAEEDNSAGSRKASFNSNGFKVRTTNTAMNGSGSTYIYMAFAEHPFGGDGAAPATAR